jgi:hypothetical protein
MSAADADAASLRALLAPEAVRERAHELLALAETGALDHFAFDPAGLIAAAERTAAETRRAYPDLRVPFHSRWRHFELDGDDLWAGIADAAGLAGARRARAEIDLAVVSVLTDAGAGADWSYRDAETGRTFARSEGLAVAGLRWFAAGGLSAAGPDDPFRADAARLRSVTEAELAAAFQAGNGNPLVGCGPRARLLNALGAALEAQPDLFAADGAARPGGLFDHLRARATGGALAAREILVALLRGLGGIWPHGLTLGGVALGDTGRHPKLRRNDATDGLVPFHKLSQWMSYSLIEPLQRGGLDVAGIDALTGLAEYRNGGLFLDAGALTLKDPAAAGRAHAPYDPLVVEWRALTIALLDRTAGMVRAALGPDAAGLPLASILQGGTWTAGRLIAAEKRPGGPPPLTVASDGTVF